MLTPRARHSAHLVSFAAGFAAGAAFGTRVGRGAPRARCAARLTINRPPDACYRALRAFAIWPHLLPGLAAVDETARGRHRWTATALRGATPCWETVLDEEPSTRLAWQSLPGSAIRARGEARFTPVAGRGTEVTLVLEQRGSAWRPDAGDADPAREALRRLRMLIETGEIATTAGQPSGRQPERVRPALRATARRLAEQPGADRDPVELTSELSFPASDAPASRALG